MKKVYIVIIGVVFILGSGFLVAMHFDLFSASQNQSNSGKTYTNGNGPFMYFKEDSYDGGKIHEGDEVKHTFIVENRGKADLLLTSVIASCGCTIATYERKPIVPGKSAPIEVIFNSNGKKVGHQEKSITVKSNAVPDTKLLTLHCEIIPK
jgi:hypothetical protein